MPFHVSKLVDGGPGKLVAVIDIPPGLHSGELDLVEGSDVQVIGASDSPDIGMSAQEIAEG